MGVPLCWWPDAYRVHQEECISKLETWNAVMESEGLHINMKKTKLLVSGDDQDVLQESDKYPCAVCCSSVCRNSFLCSQCMLWVHKRCSGITKQLVADPNYICPRCKGEFRPIDGQTMTEVDVNGTMLDVGSHFLLPWWYAVFRCGLWQCHCCQLLCGLGKVQGSLACPNL